MKAESVGAALWRFARTVLIADAVIFCLVYLVCWWQDWLSLTNLGTGLIAGGVIVWALGTASAFGGIDLATNTTYQYTRSVLPSSLSERTRQSWLDLHESYGFFGLMIVIGLIPVAVGWLLIRLA